MKKVRCKKCGKRIEATKKDMWQHALRFHWDTVFMHIGAKASDAETQQDLYNIGYTFGRELQSNGITAIDVAKTALKGLVHGKTR